MHGSQINNTVQNFDTKVYYLTTPFEKIQSQLTTLIFNIVNK